MKTESITRIDKPPSNGACRGHDPRWWYPYASKTSDGKYSENQRIARQNAAKAKSICAECDVSKECLSYAIYHEMHGIWGGKTENEREKMRRRLGIQLIVRETPLFVTSRKKDDWE